MGENDPRNHNQAMAVVALLLSAIVVLALIELAARNFDRGDPLFVATDTYAQWAMAVFAMVGTATSVLGVVWIRSTLKETRRTANAAIAANATARDIGEAQIRAYVFYKHMRWTWHKEIRGGYIFHRFRPVWSNSGQTPTRNLRIFALHLVQSEPLRDDYEFSVPAEVQFAPITLSAGNEVEGQAFDIPGEVLNDVREGRAHYYVWGVATYHDVFSGTPLHVTRFCYYAEPTGITGDPTKPGNDVDNVVRVQFSLHHRNNCSDEECTIEFGAAAPLGAA